MNDQRKRAMGRKIIQACGGDVRGKTVAVLGLTFKPNTDDMREAPSLAIVTTLQNAGARIRVYDPAGMENAKSMLNDVVYCDDAYDCAAGADAVTIVTEWDMFRALDWERIKLHLKSPILIDLRNVYRPAEMRKRGFSYHSIGRGEAESRAESIREPEAHIDEVAL